MKIIAAVVLACTVKTAFCQVVLDTSVRKRYDSIFSTCPAELKAQFMKMEEDTLTRGDFAMGRLVIDTLNKNEYLLKTSGSIIFVKDVTFKGGKKRHKPVKRPTEQTCYDFWLAGSGLKDDSLFFGISNGWFGGAAIKNVLYKGYASVYFNIYKKYDSTYKATLKSERTNQLTMPVKVIKFNISDTGFTRNNVLYIEAEIVSVPFFEEDSKFKNGYLKQQVHISYYYKLFRPDKRNIL